MLGIPVDYVENGFFSHQDPELIAYVMILAETL